MAKKQEKKFFDNPFLSWLNLQYKKLVSDKAKNKLKKPKKIKKKKSIKKIVKAKEKLKKLKKLKKPKKIKKKKSIKKTVKAKKKLKKLKKLKKPRKIKKEKSIKKTVKAKKKPKPIFFSNFFRKKEKKVIAKELPQKESSVDELRKKKLEELEKKAKRKQVSLKEAIKSMWILRIFATLFIFIVTTMFVLYRKGKLPIGNFVVAGILGLVIGFCVLYIVMHVRRIVKGKKAAGDEKERVIVRTIKQEVVAKASRYRTDLDKLYNLINKFGSLAVTEVAEGFCISRERAEEWGEILESHGLIEINYPALGEMQLCKKKLKNIK